MRKIIHVDMDCFYAAIEMRDNPTLYGKPVAIGGLASGRGVLSTCNYEARKFGLRSAMPTVQALKLCPHVILLPGRIDYYKQISAQIQAIFHHYTDKVEPLSLDEAYLDVSDSPHCSGSATLIAEQIRQDIFKETGLTASAGVAPIKFLAKIASDLNKPNGMAVIRPAQMAEFIHSMPLEKIPGVGKVSIERLHAADLFTGADVLAADPAELERDFGKLGKSLWKRCQGIDEREVSAHRERKSVGVERTFSGDITNREVLEQRLLGLLPELERRSAKHLKTAAMNKLGVKVKFADFQLTTKEQQARDIDQSLLLALFDEAISRGHGKAVRLIGVHIGLEHDQKSQLTQLALPLAN